MKQLVTKQTHALKALAFGILVMVLPNLALASGFIQPGGDSLIFDPDDLLADGDVMVAQFEKNRSYSCTVLSFMARFQNTVELDTGGTYEVDLRGDVTPQVTSSPIEEFKDNRLTFTPSVSGRYGLTIFNDNPAGTPAKVTCVETTLYGSYNTNVNDFNFLELSNLTNSTITGTITAINWDGSKVINKQYFEVDSNNRVDFDLHSSVGSNRYGMLIVTHDGPHGALQGYVSQYRGEAASFQLTSSIPLKPREQVR